MSGLAAVSLVAGLAALVPAGPASAAAPQITGTYGAVTATQFRTIASREECTEAVELNVEMNLQGLNDEIVAQGYTPDDSRPIYTSFRWSWENRITGPDNYYSDASSLDHRYPTSTDGWNVTFCPEKYGHGRILPGIYTMTGTITLENYSFRICQSKDCQYYDPLYTQPFTVTFELVDTCPQVTAELSQRAKAVAKAKKAVKKATSPRAQKKAKKKLRAAKGKLAKVRELKRSRC